jgi:predicted enzyme related to lactoylglutathione lyase
MSHQPRAGAVVFAKDLPRVAKFYEELLSMVVSHAENDHVVLESPACQLVVHAIPEKFAASIQVSTPPERRTETPIKLFFYVSSIAQARARAVALGGELNPSESEWEARGFRACDGHDPEGNVVQFRENALEVFD